MLVLGYKIATNLIYRVEITDRSKLVWICTGRLKMNDKMELENVSKNSFDVKPIIYNIIGFNFIITLYRKYRF